MRPVSPQPKVSDDESGKPVPAPVRRIFMVKLLRGVQLSEMEAATSNGVTTSLEVALFNLGAYCVLHATMGGISLTVTLKVQLTVLFPASWAVKATVVVPIGKAAPEVNPLLSATVRLDEQLSVNVGFAKEKTLLHWLMPNVIMVSFGHLSILGRMVSIIVTRVVHWARLPAVSRTYRMTFWLPTSAHVKRVLLALMMITGQLSVEKLSNTMGEMYFVPNVSR